MIEKVKSVIDENYPLYSNLANVSAILKEIGNVNWCGFYIASGETLYVGPFQGDVACAEIPFSKGVCGTSARTGKTVVVPNVHEFEGHIACSELSRSEIVVPVKSKEKVVAVIDVDSPVYDRFDEKIKNELEEIAEILSPLFER